MLVGVETLEVGAAGFAELDRRVVTGFVIDDRGNAALVVAEDLVHLDLLADQHRRWEVPWQR